MSKEECGGGSAIIYIVLRVGTTLDVDLLSFVFWEFLKLLDCCHRRETTAVIG